MSNNIKSKQSIIYKSDNFHGDRSVVISSKQLQSLNLANSYKDLYLTDIGYYPNAKNHYRNRAKGNNEHILIYCTKGQGYIQIENQSYHLLPNTFFIIEKGQAHSYKASETAPWSIYWLHFGGSKCQNFRNQFNKTIAIEPNKNARLDDRIYLFNEMLNVLESGLTQETVEFSYLYLQSLIASFFYIKTYRAAKGYKSTDPVDQCIHFMQENIHQLLKNNDIANHVKLSTSHLTMLFRHKTGASPINFFIGLKMQEAIRLLSNQNMLVKEVAYKLGYNDPFYFSRIFTKHIGVCPNTFLKNS